MTTAREQSEALVSALGRLPVAVVVVDESQTLRALNGRAQSLFNTEGLAGDLLRARPSHPLSQFLARIRGGGEIPESAVVVFPSGSRYSIEASRRSEKGLSRWIVLLIDKAPEAPKIDALLESWKLTQREQDVARFMIAGLSSAQICKQMSVAETTLKSHIKGILEKSDSGTRTIFLAKLLRAE